MDANGVSGAHNEISEEDFRKFSEFKRKMNIEAAEAQIKKIEYSLTDACIDKTALRRACQDANKLGIGAVCVLPCFVKTCVSYLGRDPQTSLIACISYPYGGDTTKIKAEAVKNAVKEGVDEVEVTAPVAFIKDGNWGYVRREFKKLKSAGKNRAVRINIETPYLTNQEISKVCALAAECGITSLRNSSGCTGGSRIDADTLSRMKNAVKDRCTIKADGVSTVSDMTLAVDFGASIVGSKNAADLARLILKAAEEV